MRRRRCRCTTSASHVVRLSLCVPLFISSRLCCLSSDTDLLLFLYVPYPLALLTHDAYVNRTMTYDHTTSSSRRSTILLTSTTDIILFYFSFYVFFFHHDALPTILSHVHDAVFRQGGGWWKGEAGGPLYVYILEKLSNKSKFESSNEKKNCYEAKLSNASVSLVSASSTLIFPLTPRSLKLFI